MHQVDTTLATHVAAPSSPRLATSPNPRLRARKGLPAAAAWLALAVSLLAAATLTGCAKPKDTKPAQLPREYGGGTSEAPGCELIAARLAATVLASASQGASATSAVASGDSAAASAAAPSLTTATPVARTPLPALTKPDLTAMFLGMCSELAWSEDERACLAEQGAKAEQDAVEACAGVFGRDRWGEVATQLKERSFAAIAKRYPAPAEVNAPPADAKKTAKGVAYRVLHPGTGTRRPTATSTVTVHYVGWTTDGKMFDSSLARGAPASFPLDHVIPGWTDGLQTMVEGERTRMWIPSELAYAGEPSAPQGMLVFDVELLRIEP